MKRTTYILLAMLVLPFVVLIVLMTYTVRTDSSSIGGDILDGLSALSNPHRTEALISRLDKDGIVAYDTDGREGVVYTVSDSPSTVDLPACKAIKVIKGGMEKGKNDFNFRCTSLSVTSTDKNSPSLTLSADLKGNMETRMEGDTLLVVFNFAKNRPDVCKPEELLTLHAEDMQLSIPAAVKQVDLRAQFMTASFKNLKGENFSFSADCRAEMEDCTFENLWAASRDLHFESGAVTNLRLDLDYLDRWTTNPEKFHIDTEHLTGSGYYENTLEKGECRRILWTPKSDKAMWSIKCYQEIELLAK